MKFMQSCINALIHFSLVVFGLGTCLIYQTAVAQERIGIQDVIGTQDVVETPQGEMIRCVGNLVLPDPPLCVGTERNDTIVGNILAGTIYGGKGDDRIQGLLGTEITFGNEGNDLIQAGNSSATLFGNDGNDVAVGSVGSNIFYGGGTVFIYGGKGDDQLVGGIDHDVMMGGLGHDNFVCSGKDDLIVDYNPQDDKKSGNCVLF